MVIPVVEVTVAMNKEKVAFINEGKGIAAKTADEEMSNVHPRVHHSSFDDN